MIHFLTKKSCVKMGFLHAPITLFCVLVVLLFAYICSPALNAFASENGESNTSVVVSADGKSAAVSGGARVDASGNGDAGDAGSGNGGGAGGEANANASVAIADFSRAQKGTNSSIENADGTETYAGYRYYVSDKVGCPVAIGMNGYVVVYVPASAVSQSETAQQSETTQQSDSTAQRTETTAQSEVAQQLTTTAQSDILKDGSQEQMFVRDMVIALDAQNANGGEVFSSDVTWYFTSNTQFDVGGVRFQFDREIKQGQFYACVIGTDGCDITSASNPAYNKPTHADMFSLVEPSAVSITQSASGFAQVSEFLTTLDWSPLWITLKTTGVAIIFIFVLGLLAAYFTLHISPRAQNIFDSIFTIPMVLPPTVCGFVLLFLCGSKTPFGQFFIDIGFPLIFSWPATVIAAVVVAFPLMYRNARGAFENLDPNMLDAARTLGWSNSRIFFKLMLPLSWSSIAAATVLAFARALGEFGATLFLAGNYIGITRTIPIAIYFEWMNGNDAVAWFWVAVIIVFSFIVILFINLWSRRTTRYRKKA